jgi:sulfide:quinone oxidoreductase
VHDDGTTKVLIAGGGVAALEAALALRDLAGERVHVRLLAPDAEFRYQPLAVSEPFGLGDVVHLDLDELLSRLGATRIPAGLTGIDAWRHVAHTTKNVEVEYDVLLVACGALPLPAVPGATTFRGPADTAAVKQLLDELVAGTARSVAFVIPWGSVWSLPAYELALLTAAHLRERDVHGVELTIVTPEIEPLQLFGRQASRAIFELLVNADVAVRGDTYAGSFTDGLLELGTTTVLEVDRVLALPRLEGAPLDGIPQTLSGFVPVDEHCRVQGVEGVYAAGDITSFTVKQGGIATQQADAAAEAIAAAAGADLEPRPFHPILRGLLLTGRAPRYLRRDLADEPDREPIASIDRLWWPPAKIVGRYLAPFLAELAGSPRHEELPEPVPGAVPIEVALDRETVEERATGSFVPDISTEAGARVVDVMTADVAVASSESTLGAIAEQLVRQGASAAAIVEDDQLVGILTLSDIVRVSAARVQPDESRVGVWMTSEPITVPPDWPASAAALLMSEYGVHHLPVVSGDRVVGMLALEDVQRAEAQAGATVLAANEQ